MSTHSKFSPSRSKNVIECPQGTAYIISHNVSNSKSVYADEGTVAHTLLELILNKRDLNYYGEEFIGLEIDDFLVDYNMFKAVNTCVNMVYSIVKNNKGAKVHIEKRVTPLNGDDDTSGTSDIIIETKDDLYVIDYKHGMGVKVNTVNNTQLLAYCSGARNFIGRDFKKYKLIIVQPRVFNPDLTIWEIDNDFLNVWVDEYTKSIKIIKDKLEEINNKKIKLLKSDEYLKVGEHCRFCPLKVLCPSYEKNLADRLGVENMSNIPNELLKNASISEKLEVLEDLQRWIYDVKAMAKTCLSVGIDIDGYSIVQGTKNRKFKAENEKIIDDLIKNYDIDLNDLLSVSTLSVAQIEKLLTKKYKKDFNVKEFNDQFTVKEKGEDKLIKI